MEYIADSVRSIPQGAYLEKRWQEIISPAPPIDAEKIIDGLVSRLGGEE